MGYVREQTLPWLMYRYYLYHPDLKQPVKISTPEGWDALDLNIRRDRTLHGVFFEYTPKLRFIKDGKAIVHNLYEQYGIEAEITLLVMKRDTLTRKWEKDYEGRLNLASPLKITELYAECNVENTGFVQKFQNQEDVRFPLSSPFDLGLHSKVLSKRMVGDGEKLETTTAGTNIVLASVFYLMFNHSPSVSEIEDFPEYPTQISTQDVWDANKYTLKAKEAGTYTFKNTLAFQFTINNVAGQSFRLRWFLEGLNFFHEIKNEVVDVGATGTDTYISALQTHVKTLNAGDEVYFYGIMDNFANLTPGDIITFRPKIGSSASLFTIDALTSFPETETKAVMMYEAYDQVITGMVGAADRLRSSFYGRTDSAPRTYAADGAGSLKAITSGLNIRGKDALSANFKDLFKTSETIDNIGIGIRREGSIEVVDVEHISHFYARRELFKLNYVTALTKEVDEQLYFNEVETGYAKWANEKISNLDEFNARREWQLPITQIKKRMSLIAPYVGSGYTIEFLRRETEDSKDSRTDNDNFVIVVRRDGGGFVSAKDEAFTSATGVISPPTAYNMELSPSRILRKHGNKLRAFLNKQTTQEVIARFSEGNNALATQLTTETAPVNESANVPIAELDEPLFFAEIYRFRAKLTREQIIALRADPYGYISFSESEQNHKRMYLLEAKRDAISNEVIFAGLKANV